MKKSLKMKYFMIMIRRKAWVKFAFRLCFIYNSYKIAYQEWAGTLPAFLTFYCSRKRPSYMILSPPMNLYPISNRSSPFFRRFKCCFTICFSVFIWNILQSISHLMNISYFLNGLVDDAVFSFCYLYSVYRFLFSCHSKRSPYDKIFYHRRPFIISFTEKVSQLKNLESLSGILFIFLFSMWKCGFSLLHILFSD